MLIKLFIRLSFQSVKWRKKKKRDSVNGGTTLMCNFNNSMKHKEKLSKTPTLIN